MVLGSWKEAVLLLGIWGAQSKYFQGALGNIIRELARFGHYFQGARAPPPPPPAKGLI